MTKLRRLGPQPADLTTHKGPFVDLNGKSATLLAGNLRNGECKPCLWSIEQTHTTELIKTEKSGRNIIFAAEEIPDPIVEFRVYYKYGEISGTYAHQGDAERVARELGGTIRRFVEDTSYGGGV